MIQRIAISLCSVATASLLATSPTSLVDPTITNKLESPVLKAAAIARERKAQGQPVYNWSIGASPFPPAPAAVEAIIQHANKAYYAPTGGIPEVAKAIASHYSTDNYPIEAKGVVIAPGMKQVILDLQRSFGGQIIHVAPYWVSYEQQATLVGKTAKTITTLQENGYKVVPSELDSLCEGSTETPHLLMLTNPGNPTGTRYTGEELAALAESCRRNNVIVFADEIYDGCCFDGEPTHMSTYLPEATISASGLSKTYALGGYRLGWAVFPKALSELRQAMVICGSNAYSCAPVPQQWVSYEVLSHPESTVAYQQHAHYIMAGLSQDCADRFRDMGLQAEDSNAAWYSWINFENHREALEARGLKNSADLAEAILKETGVVLVAGEFFGMPKKQLLARTSLVDFSGADAMEATKEADFSQALPAGSSRQWAPEMHEGMDVLSAWIDTLYEGNTAL